MACFTLVFLLCLTICTFRVQSLDRDEKLCPDVTAWHGRFVARGKLTECSALLNGQPISVQTIQEIRAYGLLQLDCPSCSYSIISDFQSCDECYVCKHNERISGCESVFIPVAAAVIVTMTVLALLVLIVKVTPAQVLDKVMHYPINKMMDLRRNRRDKKTDKRKKMIRSELRSLSFPQSSPPVPPRPDMSEPKVPMHSDLYQEVLNEMQAAGVKRHQPVHPISPVLAGVVSAALLSTTLGNVSACDSLLFMSSEGKIFEDDSFTSVSTGITPFHVGSTVCLRHQDGRVESLTLDSAEFLEYYKPIYKTCDFEIEVQSHHSCLGNGLCWSHQYCKKASRLEAVGDLAYSVPESQVGCKLVPNLSDAGCTYKQLCIWYAWQLKPKERECDVVSMISDSDIHLRFSYKKTSGDVIPFSLYRSNPAATQPITIHLLNIQTESIQSYKTLRSHGRITLGSSGADLNQGQPGLLGDLQIPLEETPSGDKWTYPLWSIQCDVSAYKYSCDSSDSGYNNSLKSDSRNVLSVERGEKFILRKRTVKAYTSALFRVPVDVDQMVKSAHCDFRVEATYGCTGCKDPAFIIVSAQNIQATGLLPFSSNCSFFLKEVACSSTPQRLQVVGAPDLCDFRVKGTNQTIVFRIDYKFKGEVFSQGISTFGSNPTLSEKLSMTLASPNFLQSLSWSMGLGVVVALITTISKSISRYMAYKMARTEVEKV